MKISLYFDKLKLLDVGLYVCVYVGIMAYITPISGQDVTL